MGVGEGVQQTLSGIGTKTGKESVETELLNRFTGNELCVVCMNECKH